MKPEKIVKRGGRVPAGSPPPPPVVQAEPPAPPPMPQWDPWAPLKDYMRDVSRDHARVQEERLLEEARILREEGQEALDAYLDARRTEAQVRADQRRAETLAHYERQRIMHRAAHISTVAAALSQHPHFRDDAIELAACAVDALLADGVVFASMGSCEDPFDS